MLTAPDLETVEPELRVLARRHGVPLSFHQRKPVGRYPEGQLFPRDRRPGGVRLQPGGAEGAAAEPGPAVAGRGAGPGAGPLRGGAADLPQPPLAGGGAGPLGERLPPLPGRRPAAGLAAAGEPAARAAGFLPAAARRRGGGGGGPRLAAAAGRTWSGSPTLPRQGPLGPESTRIHQFALNTLKELAAAAAGRRFPAHRFASLAGVPGGPGIRAPGEAGQRPGLPLPGLGRDPAGPPLRAERLPGSHPPGGGALPLPDPPGAAARGPADRPLRHLPAPLLAVRRGGALQLLPGHRPGGAAARLLLPGRGQHRRPRRGPGRSLRAGTRPVGRPRPYRRPASTPGRRRDCGGRWPPDWAPRGST